MVMFFLVAKSIDVLIVSVVGGGVKTVINVLAGHVGKHKPAPLCLECLLTHGKPYLDCDVTGSE